MPWESLTKSLNSKPRVLDGPILRKVAPRSVSVWLALRGGGDVTLTVLGALNASLASGHRHTVAVGTQLHIVCATRFRITLVTISGVRTTVTPLKDRFAPAQFTALSDDVKLSAPSFEAMISGAALGADGYATGAAVTVSVVYEQLLVTAPGVTEPKSQRVAIPGDVFVTLTATPPARPPAFALREAA